MIVEQQEIARLLSEIRSALRAGGFEWALREHDQIVALGRPGVHRKRTDDEGERIPFTRLTPPLRPGPATEFPTDIEYTAEQRLAMLVTTVRRLLVEPQDYYNSISDGWHEDLSAEHPALVLEFVPLHPDEDVSDLDVGQFWRIDTDPSDPADVEALRRKLTSIEDDLDVDFS